MPQVHKKHPLSKLLLQVLNVQFKKQLQYDHMMLLSTMKISFWPCPCMAMWGLAPSRLHPAPRTWLSPTRGVWMVYDTDMSVESWEKC